MCTSPNIARMCPYVCILTVGDHIFSLRGSTELDLQGGAVLRGIASVFSREMLNSR